MALPGSGTELDDSNIIHPAVCDIEQFLLARERHAVGIVPPELGFCLRQQASWSGDSDVIDKAVWCCVDHAYGVRFVLLSVQSAAARAQHHALVVLGDMTG